ncbi:MAG TPA: protein-glutamate O-methyltransferase CheR [Holophagaceae bacterium]|nr:protein-glutamate O-methyltransferase CheR [Holophagaceae bacterium]
MNLVPAKMQMSPTEFKQLRDFIYSKSGIFFNESKQYFLENRLSRRVQDLNLKAFSDYVSILQSPKGLEELKKLFVEITTNETSFWRNPPQIEAFQNTVLPEAAKLARERGQTKLRIWSAACSSGEEPYTLAIVVQDLKDTVLKGMTVEILGTDISEKVLAQAQDGIYGSYTLRNLTPQQLSKHFQSLGGDLFQVKPELQRLVQLKNFNLVDYNGYRMLGNFDVIFCRNVLIYFDDTVKASVLKGFHGQLHPKAYLMVGHSESIHAYNIGFELLHFSKAMGYRKK